ncbi:type II toxin-antitoxin system VapB family antitoxin [Methylobacterium sp. NEAU 140]|uniref:type II toxin-antitoxin system VapB family antitoxin n=1 Tax=Methylobacterium sp. NEAU 140 TaxID=3064945 RepID=UPI0027338DE2|nr:type II toxin-antitoxin system VapB family antitoxin [Methylobacterium sp. NEAU 140]MDP4023071.1 type II toxin-antitoxin system VapB family antitoxin [Methylobacterium sp. NEAU 140]
MDALIVESDEALSLARELAERRGTSVDEAVIESLRAALSQALPRSPTPPQPVRVPELDELTPPQRASYESLRQLTREMAQYRLPGATSDHSDMYDENGLPI